MKKLILLALILLAPSAPVSAAGMTLFCGSLGLIDIGQDVEGVTTLTGARGEFSATFVDYSKVYPVSKMQFYHEDAGILAVEVDEAAETIFLKSTKVKKKCVLLETDVPGI